MAKPEETFRSAILELLRVRNPIDISCVFLRILDDAVVEKADIDLMEYEKEKPWLEWYDEK